MQPTKGKQVSKTDYGIIHIKVHNVKYYNFTRNKSYYQYNSPIPNTKLTTATLAAPITNEIFKGVSSVTVVSVYQSSKIPNCLDSFYFQEDEKFESNFKTKI